MCAEIEIRRSLYRDDAIKTRTFVIAHPTREERDTSAQADRRRDHIA